MEPYIKNRGEDTPEVTLDATANLFKISGNSLPENALAFYEPIIKWLEEYAQNPNVKTLFDVRMDYFNTASAKMVSDVLFVFEEMVGNGHDVLVRWQYLDEDEDMKEAGEDYAEMLDVPFEYVSYSDEM